jgi:hypothetical protein
VAAGKSAQRDCPLLSYAFSIVPASGYYEWVAKPDGKQPYFVSAAGGRVLNLGQMARQLSSPRFAPETPLDPASLLGDAGDMAAEVPVERRRPRDQGKAQAVVDHGASSVRSSPFRTSSPPGR